MKKKIQFGTDGWRGLIARDFTFSNVALCAQGIMEYIRHEGNADKGLVVGYDTRFASRQFAECVAQVGAGNGIRVFLADRPAPTPVLTYQVMNRAAAGAVIVTASHNSSLWNGHKFKAEYAGSATQAITDTIEERIQALGRKLPRSTDIEEARAAGLIEDSNPMPSYLEHIRTLVDLRAIASAGLSIQADVMYGAGAGYLPALLAGGSTRVSEIHAEVNPAFPGIAQPEPIEQNLGALASAVTEQAADVGIALDGDADRLGIIDEKGVFVTPLQVFGLLAFYLLEIEGRRGSLVKSLTNTSMAYRLAEQYKDVDVIETKVGFKYIGPLLMEEKTFMGGEESGGYGFQGHIPERDGVLSALYFLSLRARKKMSISDLVEYLYSLVRPHYYRRLDVDIDPRTRVALKEKLERSDVREVAGLEVTHTDNLDGRRYHFGSAWVVVRFSGTEPLIRIYSEAENQDKVQRILDGTVSLLGL